MPGNVPRWKVIHCRTCGKVIRRFDRRRYHGHVPQNVILDAIRKHYKGEHPRKFRASIRKGVKTRTEGQMPKRKKKLKRLIKGSKAAKAYMARLRGMKKTGRKRRR